MNVSEYIFYLPNHQVVVCKTCKYCITPFGASKHFRLWHQQIPLVIRKVITGYCNNLLLRVPVQVLIPNNDTPIPELAVRVGRYCQVDGCGFIAGKQSYAEIHARTHGWTKMKPSTWEKKSVQVNSIHTLTDYRHSLLKENMLSTLLSTLGMIWLKVMMREFG